MHIAIAVWAAVLALGSLGAVNDDVRVLVGVASIIGALAALASAYLLALSADRLSGVLLLVSALIPTYFACPLNVVAVIAGLLLLAVQRSSARSENARSD